MTAILLLEDGRGFCRSSIGYRSMLHLISTHVSSSHARLQMWLADMSARTSPFCDFDLRGLADSDRQEFWVAAERAYADLVTHSGAESSWTGDMYAARSLAHLLEMHRSILAGDPPSAMNDLGRTVGFKGIPEDLDERWGVN